eukprot:m.77887 g.77887  ORF g.77887 m.77887 type:complete len:281 (-) comp12645_c0_seq2:142-984(-)
MEQQDSEILEPAWHHQLSSKLANIDNNLRLTSNVPRKKYFEPPEGSRDVVLDKFSSMSLKIEQLTRHVDELMHDKEEKTKEISRLTATLKEVSDRLRDKGVHLRTERKIQSWQQTIETKLDALMGRAMQQDNSAAERVTHTQAIRALSDEFRMFKMDTRREIDMLSSQIGDLRSTLAKFHAEIAAQGSRVRLVDQSVEDAVYELKCSGGRLQSERDKSRHLEQEIENLRHEISSLRREERTADKTYVGPRSSKYDSFESLKHQWSLKGIQIDDNANLTFT